MEQDKTVFEQKRKFDIKNDDIWKRLDYERDLLNTCPWNIFAAMDREYINALNIVTTGLYYPEYIFQSRYIEMVSQEFPSFKENCKYIDLSDVLEQSDHIMALNSRESYESHKRKLRRHLEDMLSALLGKKTALGILKDNNKYHFGCVEFSFFSFLLDTYLHKNAKHLRKKGYSKITYDYYLCLKEGIFLISESHPALGDPERIIERWKYDIKSSHDDLNNRIDELKTMVDSAVKMAYQSDFSKLHLDYLADIIENTTKSIKEVFIE